MKYLSFIISIFITSLLVPFILKAQPLSVPTKVWQKTFGGSLNDVGNDILPLPDGGFLIAGYSESNDGDVTGHHGAAGVADGWLVRTNADGSIQWQKSFGGTGNDGFKKIIKTLDGNYAAAGWSNSTDGDISNAHGNYDIWMVKFDGNGSLLKSTCFGGSKFDSLGSFLQLPDQSFVFCASTISANGDVIGNSDTTKRWIWYYRISSNNQLLWSRIIGNSGGGNYSLSIAPYTNSSVLISVSPSLFDWFSSDPFPSDLEHNVYYLNVDTSGNLLWKRKIKGAYNYRWPLGSGGFSFTNYGLVLIYSGISPGGYGYPLEQNVRINLSDFEGNFIRSVDCGFYNSSYNSREKDVYTGHPGGIVGMPDSAVLYVGRVGPQGILYPIYFDSCDALVAIRSLKTQITPGYAFKKYGGSKQDQFYSIKTISPISYITVGYTYSSDGDVTRNQGGSDVWVVKLVDSGALRKNVVRGNVFRDLNNNGVFDGSDLPYRNILVTTKKTNSNQSVTAVSSAGIYNNEVDTGQYTTSSNFNRPYYTVTPSTATSTFSGFDKADTVNFIVAPIPGLRDYYLNLSSQQILRVGRQLSYQLVYGNKGTDTLSNRTLSFVKDNKFEFLSSSPSPSSISGDTLRWTVASLLPDSQRVIAMTLRIPGIPPMPAFGDTLRSYGYIDSTLDIATGDNSARLEEIVSGSYDPNDKKESGLGKLYKDEYLGGKSLVYTIRFQNTGNDTAFRVVLRDQLSVRLKPESFELVGSSHPCKVKIENGKDVSWTFENINLPDSNRNEAASHGYVSFRIRPVSGLNVLDTIRNFAAIYFDYNEPVITNTEITVIRDNPPPSPIISGLSSSYCSNQGTVRGKVMNLPLASSGITTQVKLDATVLVIGADSSFQFTTGSLTAGNHLLTVTYTNTAGSKVLTYTVAIVATVTPDVNVTTDISYIDNLRDPVTISAINAAGGGSTPLYTFARDRNFSNVIQAESTSKDLTLSPSFFSIGESLIYVKMKTSAPCFTVQIATDSIRLFRDEATGITDPDNPGKVINVYPNPVGNGSLYITGLDVLKSYELQLSDMKGRLLAKRQVKGTVQVEWPYTFSSSGVYLISVIDARKKTLLGTIKIIKK